MRRYANKRDAAEPDIVTALERVGAMVERMNLPCDLLVRFRGFIHLLEVKDPKAYKDKRQQKQLEFLAAWNVPVVRDPESALRAIGAMR